MNRRSPPSRSMRDRIPSCSDGVYYDANSRHVSRAQLGVALDQGWRTRSQNVQAGIDVLPYAYGGGVDFNADMLYTSADLASFEAWLDEHVPEHYTGPVVLDMEGEWWAEMSVANPEQMEEIMDFFIQGLEYASAIRPNAKFGYWGLPKKHMTTDHYTGPIHGETVAAFGSDLPRQLRDQPRLQRQRSAPSTRGAVHRTCSRRGSGLRSDVSPLPRRGDGSVAALLP